MEIVNNFVLCEKIDSEDKKTASGIILAAANDKSSMFKVLRAPEHIFNYGSGTFRDSSVKAGDVVFVENGLRLNPVNMEGVGQAVYIFNYDQIVGVA